MIERAYYHSFGLVVDGVKRGEECPVVLYLNFWINGPNDCDLDFGICLPARCGARLLKLYIPFEINADEVVDLWGTFMSNEVAQVVYNSDLESRVKKDGRTIRIVLERPGVPSVVDLCRLPVPSCGLEAIRCHRGSILQVEVPEARSKTRDADAYLGFRFRIPYKPVAKDGGIRAYLEAISSPIVSRRWLASIEVNEHRGLPPDIRQQVTKQRAAIERASIAVVSRSGWPVTVGGDSCRIRPLESDVWEAYQPKLVEGRLRGRVVPRRWLVYQWRKARGDKMSFQFEWVRTGVNKSSLALFLFLFFFLNVLSEMLIRWLFQD